MPRMCGIWRFTEGVSPVSFKSEAGSNLSGPVTEGAADGVRNAPNGRR